MLYLRILLASILVFLLIGCQSATTTKSNEPPLKVGLLLPHSIDDKGWNSKGYEGLLKIHSSFNADVIYLEEINTPEKIQDAVEGFVDEGVHLIFGHGQMYAPTFMDLKGNYPGNHFVVFNGDVEGENITSLHFKGYSMGFFAGMLASEMSETKVIGVIGAYPWQPEVEGFVEGALYQDSNIEVEVDFVSSWVDIQAAKKIYHTMLKNNVDVFYPAGDGYHVSIIEEIKKNGLYAIGFIGDQSDLGGSTVLTSTIQHVDALYEIVVQKFLNGELEAGNKYFDFEDGVISLGDFSSEVPIDLQAKINTAIKKYIETGKLPHE